MRQFTAADMGFRRGVVILSCRLRLQAVNRKSRSGTCKWEARCLPK